MACAGKELHSRGRIRFILAEVEKDPKLGYMDEFEEVDGQGVGLGSIGLPIGVRGRGKECGDAAGGFVGGDGPGGEGVDVPEAVEGGVVIADCLCGMVVI